jgi:uridine phosphorylase
MPAYLDPMDAIAPDAILTDDPKSALELAVALAGTPRMSNLAHGLWGYLGSRDGREMTVQSLGIGGPSAAAVLADLAELGVERAVRVGSCIGLDPALAPGSAVVVGRVLSPHEPALYPDPVMTAALEGALGTTAEAIHALDFHGDPVPGDGGAAADLSSRALFATASRVGVRLACVLVVGQSAGGKELTREELEGATVAVGAELERALQPS